MEPTSAAKPPPSWKPRMFMSKDSWLPRLMCTQPGHASMYLCGNAGCGGTMGEVQGRCGREVTSVRGVRQGV